MDLQKSHNEAQAKRRAIETEMNSIDAEIGKAIRQADAALMNSLRKRKAELPSVYIEASTAERHAADSYYRSLYEAAQQAFDEGDAYHETCRQELLELQLRHKAELEAAEAKAEAARVERNTRETSLGRAKNTLNASVFGYQKALGALAVG